MSTIDLIAAEQTAGGMSAKSKLKALQVFMKRKQAAQGKEAG